MDRSEIEVLCFDDNHMPSTMRARPPVPVTRISPLRGWGRWSHIVQLLVRGRPLEYCFYDSPAMCRTIERLVPKFDLLLVEETIMAGVALRAALPSGIIRVLNTQNAEVARELSMRKDSTGFRKRFRSWVHMLALRRFEPWALSRFEGCIFVADADRDVTARGGAGNVPSVVIGNGVTIPKLAPAPLEGGGRRVVFLGSLDYAPNRRGLEWLLHSVRPTVLQASPDVTFSVIGSGKLRGRSHLAGLPGVEIVGVVSDPFPFLCAADVIAVPIFSGGGSKLKTLEALASGRPVVATPEALRGLDITPDKDALVSSSPSGFASHIIDLLSHPARAREIGANGQLAVRPYDWGKLADRLYAFLQDLLRESRSPLSNTAS
jgi:glycosyltransferase involved in cell wall biosynthesis